MKCPADDRQTAEFVARFAQLKEKIARLVAS
jgi:hypothetical protein